MEVKKKGFTLIEIIASVAIMLLIVLVTSAMFLSYGKIINNNKEISINRSEYNLIYSKIMNIGYRKKIQVLNNEYLLDYNNYNSITGLFLEEGSGNVLIGTENNNLGESEIYVFNGVSLSELDDGYVSYTSKTPLGNDLENITFSKLKNNLVKVNLKIKTKEIVKEYTFIVQGALSKTVG